MHILSNMSLWGKVKLLTRIVLLRKGFLKYQIIEDYNPSEEEVDIQTEIVFFWQPSNVFCWLGKPQKKYKSYAAYKADQERPFVWETASIPERKANLLENHSWPSPIMGSGTPLVLRGGESGFFNAPSTTTSGTYNAWASDSTKNRLLDWVNSEEGRQKLNTEAVRQHGVVLKGYPLDDITQPDPPEPSQFIN